MRHSIESLTQKKRYIHMAMIFLAFIGSIIFISVCTFTLYFNNVFNRFFIDSVDDAQQKTIEKLLQIEFTIKNISSQLLNNYDISSLLYYARANDLEHIHGASTFVKFIRPILNFHSFQIIDPKNKKIWLDTSLNPIPLNEYLKTNKLSEQILNDYISTKRKFYSNQQNNYVTYVFEPTYHEYYILYQLDKSYFTDILPDNLLTSSKSWLYSDNLLVWDNTKDHSDILQAKNISSIIEKNKANFFVHSGRLYVCNSKNNVLCITEIDYKSIIANALKTASFIWITISIFILITILLLNFSSNRFKNLIKTYISRIDAMEYKINNDAAHKILFKLFSDIALGANEKANLYDMLDASNRKNYAAMILKIDSFSNLTTSYSMQDVHLYKYGICNIVEELFSQNGRCKTTNWDNDSIIALISFDQYSDVLNIIKDVNSKIQGYIEVSLSIAVSKPLISLNELISHANTVTDLINYTYINDPQCVIVEDQHYTQQNSEYPLQIQDNIIKALDEQRFILVNGLVESFVNCAKLQSPSIAMDWFLTFSVNIFHRSEYLRSNHINHKNIVELTSCSTLKEAAERLLNMILAGTCSDNDKPDANAVFIKTIEQMTAKNYNNPDYDLTYIASALNLSKMYVGRKFRTLLKKHFTQYLTEYRIKRAYELLKETNYTSNDIATLCGFSSTTYFVTLFKKTTGITPQEYRLMSNS